MTGNSRLDIDGPCSPTVRNCTFSDNGVGDPREPWYRTPYSQGEWGLIAAPTLVCSSGASPLIEGNTFSNNGGFGIDVMSASPTIENNTFSGNREGGVRIDQAFTGYEPMPVLSGNTFRDHGLPDLLANPPGERALDPPIGAVPAVQVDDADALFNGNLFEGNEVGVAVFMNFSGEPVFRGDVFRDNVVGVWTYKGSPEFFDCAFANIHYDFWITAYSHVKAHNTTFDETKLRIENESRIDADGRSYLSAAGGIGILGLLVLLFIGGTETGKVKFFALMFPLFSRMKGEEVLDQFTRGQVYGLIRGNPGIHYSEIKRVLLIGNGTLAHHLSVLEREGFIKSRRKGINKLFYPARLGAKHRELEGRFPTGEEVGEGIRLSELQEDIIDLVSGNPGITQSEIVTRLDVPKQTVSYNVGNLSSYGLLTVLREGNTTRLFPKGNEPATD
ncbi:MAG: winged helix-turn-helix transcriptional regulator [Thermoplasmata archaeon]|nr:winged helix-turn-helix transcriptional regulator [Thermoplasmata archaeon]NIS13300.1 winged helix-turn-helix transcriptional regulator [Thermoplasmata archaeon]NIS21198.1 winged helix-turn-helix transcriptional regulator [Thermoplasmata archaeon]NIT78692.1 winged helix-turn-helix transcriptional regulator [Thermoplasmata archaeon]NIV79950.1 winged helix-turn-helix transcriptional regulator [Thermoplasmata archaeon]